MNEIVEESRRLANPIWQRYDKTGWVTLVCRYPPWYLLHEEVSKKRKIEKKKLRLVNAAMSGLTAEIFLAINMVVFVGAGQYTFRCTFPALNGHVLHYKVGK